VLYIIRAVQLEVFEFFFASESEYPERLSSLALSKLLSLSEPILQHFRPSSLMNKDNIIVRSVNAQILMIKCLTKYITGETLAKKNEPKVKKHCEEPQYRQCSYHVGNLSHFSLEARRKKIDQPSSVEHKTKRFKSKQKQIEESK